MGSVEKKKSYIKISSPQRQSFESTSNI